MDYHKVKDQSPSMSHSPLGSAVSTSNGQLHGLSSRDLAERLQDLASFIQLGFCTGTLMLDLPILPTMKHLVKRLNAYAYGFAIDSTPSHVLIPSLRTPLDAHGAKKLMGQLARFFERKAEQLERDGLGGDAEVGIARDLRFAAKIVNTMLELKQESPRSSDGTGSLSSTLEEQEVILDENRRVRFVSQKHVAVTAQSPSSVPNRGSETAIESDKHSSSESSLSTPIGATTPVELRPTPDAHEHAPHPLQGQRLHSRCGVPDEERFKELCSMPDKILVHTPDLHTTIQIGHRTTDFNQPHDYVDASILGFPGVNALKLMHPLCARQTRMLDYDVLRYIDIVLKDSRAKRPQPPSARPSSSDRKRDRANKRAEMKSREVVELELRCRVWEMEQEEAETDAARYELSASQVASLASIAKSASREEKTTTELPQATGTGSAQMEDSVQIVHRHQADISLPSTPSAPSGTQTPNSYYRSDRQPTHPLQELVGKRELVNSASIKAEAGSSVSQRGDEVEKISDSELMRSSDLPPASLQQTVAQVTERAPDSAISQSPTLKSSRGRNRLEQKHSYDLGCSARDRLNLEMQGKSGEGMIYPPDVGED